MDKQTKSELMDDHGKLVYQSSQIVGSKDIKLRAVVEQLPDMEAVLSTEAIKPVGHWEEVEMPDTLDLAERASLSVNGLIRNMKPDQYYAGTQTFRFDILGPYDDHTNWCMPMDFVRTLPFMRLMCGSEEHLDVECAAMRAILKQIRKDGQLYFPISKDGPPAGTIYPGISAATVTALLQCYVRDNNHVWLEWAKMLCDGLKQDVLQVDDYAYYPPEWSLDAEGKWHWTLRGSGNIAKEPREPMFDQEGYEGCSKDSGWTMVRCYEIFGDEAALEQARRMVRFCLKPKMWVETHDTIEQALQHVQNLVRECVMPGYPLQKEEVLAPGYEHGIWEGHTAGNLSVLQGLLIFAKVTENEQLKQIVHEGYEHGRRQGVIRLGFIPSWLKAPKYGRPTVLAEVNEGCGIANLLRLAVMLTDEGLGDYWDDVDSIIRNHLIELQITDLDLMKRVAGAGSEYDETFKRIVGGFTTSNLTSCRESMTNACCTATGSRSLYYAWEGITRFNAGVATVNLFLNRVSPWMDVSSYLPYQGKVVLHNKKAHTLLVRIPYWVDTGKLTCYLNDRVITPLRAGNYLMVKDLKAKDIIRLEFPVRETIETYTICGTRYTATFRGSTVVDITPRDADIEEHRNKYPFFRREHLKSLVAPMRKRKRFVTEKLFPVI